MPLTYLLYRCPACGHDPLEGTKDLASCPECGTRYSRGREGARINVQDPEGGFWEVPAHRLTARLEALLEKEWADGGAGGPLPRAAEVRVRQSGREEPVRWGGELLGFAESMGDFRTGRLELTLQEVVLEVRKEDGDKRSKLPSDGGMYGSVRRWPLLDIRAVQTSSSSLQFSPRAGGLVELRFPHDSPFRWEVLLREALRRAYDRAGLGTIVEFQPRVVAE